MALLDYLITQLLEFLFAIDEVVVMGILLVCLPHLTSLRILHQ